MFYICKMKYILLLTVSFLFSCEKQSTEKACQTCTLDVHYVSNQGQSMDYVEKTVDNCDGAIQDGHVTQSGGGTNGDLHWSETKTWHCK